MRGQAARAAGGARGEGKRQLLPVLRLGPAAEGGDGEAGGHPPQEGGVLAVERADGAGAVREAGVEEGGREGDPAAVGGADKEGLPDIAGAEGAEELQAVAVEHGGDLRPDLRLQQQPQPLQDQELPDKEAEGLGTAQPQQPLHHPLRQGCREEISNLKE